MLLIKKFRYGSKILHIGLKSRVLEPVCLGRLQEFSTRSRLLVKENIILEFFKTYYELSKILSNTCTSSTCRSYFMFTL